VDSDKGSEITSVSNTTVKAYQASASAEECTHIPEDTKKMYIHQMCKLSGSAGKRANDLEGAREGTRTNRQANGSG